MSLLLDGRPIVIRPPLVRRLGMVEAAIVQQLHYWSDRATRTHDGHAYVYKTYQDWADELGISAKQARGATDKLRREGVVIAIQNPTDSHDRTLWWRIDHDVLEGPSAPEGRSKSPAREGRSDVPKPAGPSAPQGSSYASASGSRAEITSQRAQTESAQARGLSFRGKRVPQDLAAAATLALDAWNTRTHQNLKPLKASGKPSDALSRILGAMIDYPEVVELWPRMIAAALSAPWWQDNAPGTGVVFGPNVVERYVQAAQQPAGVTPLAPRRGRTRDGWTGADAIAIGRRMDEEARARGELVG